MTPSFSPFSGLYIRMPGRRLAPRRSDDGAVRPDATLFDLGSGSFRDRDLFRQFAKVEPTPEGVRSFLEAHADLCKEAEVEMFVALPYDHRSIGPEEAVFRELLQLRRWIDLWDMIQNDDRDGLARYITPRSFPQKNGDGLRHVLYYRSPPPGEPLHPHDVTTLVTIANFDPKATRTKTTDLRPAARAILMGVISAKLEQGFNGQVSESPGKIGKMELHMAPRQRLVGLWFQFADEVTGNFTPDKCFICDKWLRPTKHRDRIYCGDNCKVQACKLRKKARAMQEQGKSTQAIAEKLKISEEKVERLLATEEEE
jgi:hypothetical protein